MQKGKKKKASIQRIISHPLPLKTTLKDNTNEFEQVYNCFQAYLL